MRGSLDLCLGNVDPEPSTQKPKQSPPGDSQEIPALPAPLQPALPIQGGARSQPCTHTELSAQLVSAGGAYSPFSAQAANPAKWAESPVSPHHQTQHDGPKTPAPHCFCRLPNPSPAQLPGTDQPSRTRQAEQLCSGGRAADCSHEVGETVPLPQATQDSH